MPQTCEQASSIINSTSPMQANMLAHPETAPLAVDERQREAVLDPPSVQSE